MLPFQRPPRFGRRVPSPDVDCLSSLRPRAGTPFVFRMPGLVGRFAWAPESIAQLHQLALVSSVSIRQGMNNALLETRWQYGCASFLKVGFKGKSTGTPKPFLGFPTKRRSYEPLAPREIECFRPMPLSWLFLLIR